MKIYDRHNQSNALDYINTIIDKCLFRIRKVRTDNGHEFQAKFTGDFFENREAVGEESFRQSINLRSPTMRVQVLARMIAELAYK